MVLANDLRLWLKDRRARRDARFHEEGRKEGREELLGFVAEWNRRRLAAESRGEPFDEPPPGVNSTD